jgi:hypothetical protein
MAEIAVVEDTSVSWSLELAMRLDSFNDMRSEDGFAGARDPMHPEATGLLLEPRSPVR